MSTHVCRPKNKVRPNLLSGRQCLKEPPNQSTNRSIHRSDKSTESIINLQEGIAEYNVLFGTMVLEDASVDVARVDRHWCPPPPDSLPAKKIHHAEGMQRIPSADPRASGRCTSSTRCHVLQPLILRGVRNKYYLDRGTDKIVRTKEATKNTKCRDEATAQKGKETSGTTEMKEKNKKNKKENHSKSNVSFDQYILLIA